MPRPRASSITPSHTIAGGRITLHGSDFGVGPTLPVVHIGTSAARVVFASEDELGLIVPTTEAGLLPVRMEGVDGGCVVDVGVPLATGLHQVDNPVFDALGNLYVTYSGTRGQQVPVSIFKVTPAGARESFSSDVTNPTSMALDPDGTLFVSSRFEGAVYRLADDGSAELFASDLGVACGLAFAPDGTLFVGDRSGTVFEVARNGSARAFATLPASVAAFHVALGADGLYVTGPTLSASDVVYRITFTGEVSISHRGFGRPQGMAIAPDGTLYVVEALAGVSGVYRLPVDASPELVVSGPRLVGVAFGPAGDGILCSSDTAYRFASPLHTRTL
ncbi:MAG: IPT/TIG domain-containing protein [Vicinamibacterales bacterium]